MMELMTVKQVSSLTGVSARTLQYYDEIGLLKPARLTEAGYRLYDERALGELQQILFFKELNFKLREIRAIMSSPGYDRTAAFEKQRELLRLKRKRLDTLLSLLDKLAKGETCMDFKDFDLSEYFCILGEFRKTHTEEIIKQYGSLEQFDRIVSAMRANKEEVAVKAVEQYGSVEKYTRAMEKSIRALLTGGPPVAPEEVEGLAARTEALTRRVTEDLNRDVSSPEVRERTAELVAFVNECSRGAEMGEGYWPMIAKGYESSQAVIEATDRKYGPGASRYLGAALRAYLKGKQ